MSQPEDKSGKLCLIFFFYFLNLDEHACKRERARVGISTHAQKDSVSDEDFTCGRTSGSFFFFCTDPEMNHETVAEHQFKGRHGVQ